jgi:hypothetical protein
MDKLFTLIKKNIGYIIAAIFLLLFIQSSVSSCQDKKIQEQLIENERRRAVLKNNIDWILKMAKKDRELSEAHEKLANREKEIIDSVINSIQIYIKYKRQNYTIDESQYFFDTITKKSTLKPVEW